MKDFEEMEKKEVETIGECFDKTIPIENGDSVLFVLKKNYKVLVGKYVEAHNCVITPDGEKIDKKNIEEWYNIPFNLVQEKLNTDAFVAKYNELTFAVVNEDEIIEKYIQSNAEGLRTPLLNEDKEFLLSLFTRNVRNKKIDFKNYKFMSDVLFDKDNKYIEYDSNIDLGNLKTICYNMYSIMNKISKETYDEICEKLNSFNDNEVVSI